MTYKLLKVRNEHYSLIIEVTELKNFLTIVNLINEYSNLKIKNMSYRGYLKIGTVRYHMTDNSNEVLNYLDSVMKLTGAIKLKEIK